MTLTPPDKFANLPSVAYFSMEIGLEPQIPTYSGGLGVLAGDTLRAAADLGIPMVGVSLLHRKGYFSQYLDASGMQSATPVQWSPEDFLEPLPARISLRIEGRAVMVCAWKYGVKGIGGHTVPVILLDSAISENDAEDQSLTDFLYGGDARYRLRQEVLLGFGGIAMLRALGFLSIRTYHMNEGHSAFLTLALLEERIRQTGRPMTPEDKEIIRRQCVFTTHTPVPAGHDQFSFDQAGQVLGEERTQLVKTAECCLNGVLNMTYLGLSFSHYINGVSMRHQAISRTMFPSYPINSITNGVHAGTWTSPPFQALYDRHMREWRTDNHYLRYGISIPLSEIWEAHRETKRALLAEVQKRAGARLDPAVMTIGFARRAAAYKRPDLLFTDLDRLKRMAQKSGPLQVIYGGKAHPRDEAGKSLIRKIFEAKAALGDSLPVVYLQDYDMAVAKMLCSGVDLWLNTPQKPQEASGTSGMKAALNGVPSLSILDGWWVEGHVEGVTGWSIGEGWEAESNPAKEISSLYNKLETVILPLYYGQPLAFAKVMRSAIALNGSFFNAQRMMWQYVNHTYQAHISSVRQSTGNR